MPKTKKSEKAYIYGKNALAEALEHAPHIIRRVHLASDIEDARLRKLLTEKHIPVSALGKGDAREAVGDASHQGVIAVIDTSHLTQDFGEFLARLEPSADTAIAVLGEVQDPHNVGAIIRSAAAFGFAGVLIPEHNQAQVTGTVVKTSAGMAFRIPLVSIGNVNQALRDLKDKGFWIYGLAMDGQPVRSETFDRPAAFVFGNEGAGIREKTLETCDITLSIPMHPCTESLNVAVSAGIVFNEWARQHPAALSA